MLQYLFVFILFSFFYRKYYKKDTNIYYNSSILPYLEILKNYKSVDEHAYKKTMFHVNRFYFYHFENNFEKCEKHYNYIMDYLNRIKFRLENDIDRDKALHKLIQNIETVLIQHIYLVSSRLDKYYNNIRTQPEYYSR